MKKAQEERKLKRGGQERNIKGEEIIEKEKEKGGERIRRERK